MFDYEIYKVCIFNERMMIVNTRFCDDEDEATDYANKIMGQYRCVKKAQIFKKSTNEVKLVKELFN